MLKPFQSSNLYYVHNIWGFLFGHQFFVYFNSPLSILLCWSISAQVFLGFPVSISKCWDGSRHSKLPLHAYHAASRLKFGINHLHVCSNHFHVCWHVKEALPPGDNPIAINKYYYYLYFPFIHLQVNPRGCGNSQLYNLCWITVVMQKYIKYGAIQ